MLLVIEMESLYFRVRVAGGVRVVGIRLRKPFIPTVNQLNPNHTTPLYVCVCKRKGRRAAAKSALLVSTLTLP